MACDEKNYWHTPNTYKGQGVYGVRRSKGFTGVRNGKQYYRGQLWLGPTNAVGHLPQGGALIETQGDRGGLVGLAPIGAAA